MSSDGRRRRPDRHVRLSREMDMDMDEWLDDDPFTDDDLGIPSTHHRDDRMPEYPEPPSTTRRRPSRPQHTHARTAPSANNDDPVNHVHRDAHARNVDRSAHADAARNVDRRARVRSGRSVDDAGSVRGGDTGRRRIRRPDDDRTVDDAVRMPERASGDMARRGRQRSSDMRGARMHGDRARSGGGRNPRAENHGDDRNPGGRRMYTLSSGRVVPVDAIIDDPWELVDDNGVFRDGPDVPHLRHYPTGIDDLVVERTEIVNHKKRVRHLHAMTYEEFSPLMGTTEKAKRLVREGIYEQPYDSAGYLRVFLMSKGMARVFELGSKASAKDFADEMNDNLDRFMSEQVDVSYREGSSADYKEPDKWRKH